MQRVQQALKRQLQRRIATLRSELAEKVRGRVGDVGALRGVFRTRPPPPSG